VSGAKRRTQRVDANAVWVFMIFIFLGFGTGCGRENAINLSDEMSFWEFAQSRQAVSGLITLEQ
jgi:hypothetical protein